MNHHRPKGIRVSKSSRARKPLLRRTGLAGLVHSGAFGGSGAPSLRLLSLAMLMVAAALLALTASSALAAKSHVPGISFGAPGSAAGQLSLAPTANEEGASGVAVNEATGDIYVADTGNHRVDQFSSGGDFIRAWGWGVRDGSAELQVCTTLSGCQAGLAGLGHGQFANPRAIAVDNSSGGASEVYVSEIGELRTPSNRIQKFSPEGTLITGWGDEGEIIEGPLTNNTEFNLPNGLGVDSSGNLWVGASQIFEFDRTGTYLRSRGSVATPLATAVDAAGSAYIADGFGAAVRKYDPSGELLGEVFKAESAPFERPTGLALDTSGEFAGELYVGEGATISIIAPGCEPKASPPFCPAGNQLQIPPLSETGGLAVDSQADVVYVADIATNMILSFIVEQPGVPTVDTANQYISAVTSVSAVLHSEVNPRSEEDEEPTTWSFQYGPCDLPTTCASSPYPLSTILAVLAPDFESHLVAAQIVGLQPHITYHFRVIAHNSHGEGLPGAEMVFTTQSTGALSLLDSRQWELVTPVQKYGALIEPLAESGVVQAAADGSAITFLAATPTEVEPEGYADSEQLLSRRDDSGWTTAGISTPHRETPGGLLAPEYKYFSTNLSAGIVQPNGSFNPDLSTEDSESTAYFRSLLAGCGDACYRPAVTGAEGFANVPPGIQFGENESCEPQPSKNQSGSPCGPQFLGATEDLSHLILSSSTGLTAASEGQGGAYEWSEGTLYQVNVLPNGLPTQDFDFGAQENGSARSAISADGSRIVWKVRSGTSAGLYLRANTTSPPSSSGACDESGRACTLQLDVAEFRCLAELNCKSGGGVFEIASTDGSRIFFTDENPLTEDSGAEKEQPDLYECRIVLSVGDSTCELTDLTPRQGSENAAVQGAVLGASEDGDYIYFVAKGELTTNTVDNGAGPESAQAGKPNLYLSHEGTTSFVTTLSGGDEHDWQVGGGTRASLASQPTRVSRNGRWLVLMSQGTPTGYDNRDVATSEPVAEVYIYDAVSGRLACASCSPTGVRPRGVKYATLEAGNGGLVGGRDIWPNDLVGANVPGSPRLKIGGYSLYQPHYLTDSGRLFFNSNDGLVPQDSNRTEDVYEYETPGVGNCSLSTPTYAPASGGCVDLVSSGTSRDESAFLDASTTGDDVFFLTRSQLARQDEDASIDIYDAHACPTGTAVPCLPGPPTPAPNCDGDACQPPAVPPNHPTPGTVLLNGPENAHECAKGNVRRGGKCVKKRAKRKHHKNKSSHKRSSNKSRGAIR